MRKAFDDYGDALKRLELFLMTMWVAESLPAFKDDVLNAIEKFIASHLATIP